jgi:murein DD-endopeptidase MepM/ murein hydrolase activator NlpD
VHAIGDGTVTKVARDHAAGNYIKIRHVNGYESGYLHLSRFAKGMKSGKRIRQGETIGYVGSTGYATGPHLDFRIQKNGSYLNPRQIISPRSEPVSKKQMGKFKTLVQELRPMLNPETTVGTITVPNESN